MAEVLATHLEPLRGVMAVLRGTLIVSPQTRDAELQAAMRQHRDRLHRVDEEREKILNLDPAESLTNRTEHHCHLAYELNRDGQH